jgi:hypothetical protein
MSELTCLVFQLLHWRVSHALTVDSQSYMQTEWDFRISIIQGDSFWVPHNKSSNLRNERVHTAVLS